MAKTDKGIMPVEMRNSISAAQKERYARWREALEFRAHVLLAAEETPDRPVSEVVQEES